MDDLHTFLSDTVRIVCTSDTHNDDPRMHLPLGDILIHAGDLTDRGTFLELRRAFDWVTATPHPVKIIIAGQSLFDL